MDELYNKTKYTYINIYFYIYIHMYVCIYKIEIKYLQTKFHCRTTRVKLLPVQLSNTHMYVCMSVCALKILLA